MITMQCVIHDGTGRILQTISGSPETMAGHLDDPNAIWIEHTELVDPARFMIDPVEGILLPAVAVPPDLELLRAEVLTSIDQQAERIRQLYITPGAGQALEYQATETEGVRFAAEGVAGEPYPMLSAELEARQATGEPGLTLADVASECVAHAASWRAAASEIKRLRRQHKIIAAQSTTVEQLQAARSVPWPYPS